MAASAFQILLGDAATPADDDFYDALTTLEVEENADLPGAIQLTLPIWTGAGTAGDDLTVVGDPHFQPYSRIAVVISVDGAGDSCIFDGYLLSHKLHLDGGILASTATIWGQDMTCVMNLEEKAKEWTQTDGAIANAIFGDPKYKLTTDAGNTRDDSGEHPARGHTVMQRGTDAQFLRDRARRAGKLFRVCCTDTPGRNVGYFVTPTVTGAPAATLVLNPTEEANVDALDIDWDVARPTRVEAKLLVLDKQPIGGVTNDPQLRELDTRTLPKLVGDRAMQVMLTTAADDEGELTSRARSVLREAGWFVRCSGEADVARLGKVLRAATVVEINGAGNVHSGNYFVWSVRHTITALSHRMKFVLVRNALGAV